MNHKLFFLMAGLVVLFFILLATLFRSKAYGKAGSQIGTTIKISICGNEVAEGGEDCDNDDLGEGTCIGLGYASGELKCDIACSFDTSGCSSAPTPTPTPAPVVTSTPALALTSTPGPVATSSPAPAATAALIPSPAIPAAVLFFDADNSGKIESTEVFQAVKAWVSEWRVYLKMLTGETVAQENLPLKCDLNKDEKCNPFDLSILLYYINR